MNSITPQISWICLKEKHDDVLSTTIGALKNVMLLPFSLYDEVQYYLIKVKDLNWNCLPMICFRDGHLTLFQGHTLNHYFIIIKESYKLPIHYKTIY